jgi:hypothetical protein
MVQDNSKQDYGPTADDRDNGAGKGDAKTTTATSTPPPRAAVHRVETSN